MKVILAIAMVVSVVAVYSLEHDVTVDCPPVDGENATLLPNPYCCECYFACSNGEAIPMMCPDGLHFDVSENVCNWPEEAGCEELEPPQDK